MSFRDSINQGSAETANSHAHVVTDPTVTTTTAITEDPTVSFGAEAPLSSPSAAATPGFASEEPGPVYSYGSVEAQVAQGEGDVKLPCDIPSAPADACSDHSGFLGVGRRPSSSSYTPSVRSAGRIGRLVTNRIIYPSAPITFTRAFCTAPTWGAYSHHPHGYLDAETVRAAAAADESLARRQARDGVAASKQEADGHKNKAVKPSTPHEVDTIIAQREEGKELGVQKMCTRASAQRNLPDAEAEQQQRSQPTNRGASSSASCQMTNSSMLPAPASIGSRAPLGSWLFGGGEPGTELERLLNKESKLAEAVAARRELAATKLLQEDMEAMIANLQQVFGLANRLMFPQSLNSEVKTFLVRKLQECETALLTTAQERDDLELTLQQIQGGIQDSIAEKRRLMETYKEQLAAKEREAEELRAQLDKAAKDVERLDGENKMLRGQVDVARTEAADVAAAGGFRIEEYQTALRTLLERNKTQNRELKRLRGQLIKTREDYANALARIDELESLEEFQKKALEATKATIPTPEQSPWGPTEALQDELRFPGFSLEASDHSRSFSTSSRQRHGSSHCDRGKDKTACDSDSDTVGSSTADGRKTADAQGTNASMVACEVPQRSSGHSEKAGTARGRSLGRSVKGLLASGVSRVLQRLEHAMTNEGESDEVVTQQEPAESYEAPEGKRLYEEAALFLQRTSGGNDLIVQLEEDSPSHEGEDDGIEQSEETGTISNVARSVWQAANELLADRALPPARLSTLRTVAASNPSAWEVLRERHRAAKSMPLFSSIPPAVYPLVAGSGTESPNGSDEGPGGTTSSSSPVKTKRNNAGLNARPPRRTERIRREDPLKGSVIVEMQSDANGCTAEPVSDAGENRVWQSEVVGPPSLGSEAMVHTEAASKTEASSTQLNNHDSTDEVERHGSPRCGDADMTRGQGPQANSS